MLNISEELKELYKTDNIYKEISLYFPDLSLTINNDRIVSESFTLTESLCSEQDLQFGKCESAMMEITIFDVVQDISGQKVIVTQKVNNAYNMQLGTYIVESCTLEDNRRFKKIIAYDYMRKFDIDAASWYNSLTFPLTVKQFRDSLCQYVNVQQETQELVNDGVLIEKTIEISSIIARDILECIAELNGCFGHITRNNKLKYISLDGLGLYPSEKLHPADDLFPAESGEIFGDSYEPFRSTYQSIKYEEYIVEQITGVQIRKEEGDIGVLVGSEDNLYLMQGNFLIYGKPSEELEQIASRILKKVKNKFYRPHNTTMAGLPYLEVGDSVLIITKTDAIESLVMNRCLKGIQALKDEISATGELKRENKLDAKNLFDELKGKTAVLKRNVDELSNTITDTKEGLESQIKQTVDEITLSVKNTKEDLQSQITQNASSITLQVNNIKDNLQSQITQNASSITSQVNNIKDNLQSQITQNAESINLQVSNNMNELQSQITQNSTSINTKVEDTKNNLQSQITQTSTSLSTEITNTKSNLQSQITQQANQIGFKVSQGDVISAINMSPETIKINASKVNISGVVTFSDLQSEGSTVINGSNIKSGTITGNLIKGGTIEGAALKSTWIDGNDVITTQLSTGGYSFKAAFGSSLSLEVHLNHSSLYFPLSGGKSAVYARDYADVDSITCKKLNNATPITSNNIYDYAVSFADQSSKAYEADRAYWLGNAQKNTVFISLYGHLRPIDTGSKILCGTSDGYWDAVYAKNGTIQTSDRNKKHDISILDERYKLFAKKILKLPRSYKMIDGTSGRTHIGLIAQDIEDAMTECNISDMEFAGLVKAPIHQDKLDDGEYDTTSPVIGHSYHLRYDEFIPLILEELNYKNLEIQELKDRLDKLEKLVLSKEVQN